MVKPFTNQNRQHVQAVLRGKFSLLLLIIKKMYCDEYMSIRNAIYSNIVLDCIIIYLIHILFTAKHIYTGHGPQGHYCWLDMNE